MPIRLVLSLHRALLLVALTVALAGTGFAHRMPEQQDEALTFARVNGASLSDICGDDLAAGSHISGDCQACQITGAAGLPSLTGELVDLELALRAAVIAPLDQRPVLHSPNLAHRSQGPPVA